MTLRTSLSAAAFVVLGAAAVRPAAAQSCGQAARLASAVTSGTVDDVRDLLNAGVGVDCVSAGKTPLMHAAGSGRSDMILYLLQRDADARRRGPGGRTALRYAADAGHDEVARILAAYLAVKDSLDRGLGPTVVIVPELPSPKHPPPPAPPPLPSSTRPRRPMPPRPAAPASPAEWAPFGTYRVGDRVQVWSADRRLARWRTGTVTELGIEPDATSGSDLPNAHARQYRISDDRFPSDGEWHAWGEVAGLDRQPHWTAFFVGDWTIGAAPGAASGTRRLHIGADGTYLWATTGADVRGRWTPVEGGPGIVLLGGADGRDWTMQNQTTAADHPLQVETAGLFNVSAPSVVVRRGR